MQFEKEKTLEVKRRLALRRDEPELRIFEQKLRDALVFKEQICQMKENRHREIQKEVNFYIVTIFKMEIEVFQLNYYCCRLKSGVKRKS